MTTDSTTNDPATTDPVITDEVPAEVVDKPAKKRRTAMDRAVDDLLAVYEEIKRLSGTLSTHHQESLEAAVYGVRDAANSGKTPAGEPDTNAEIFPTPPLTPDSLTLTPAER